MAATSRKVWPIVLSLVVLAGSFGLAAGLARWQGGVGQRTIRVPDRAAIQPSYEFAAGRFILDLSAVDLGEIPVPIAVDHHVGRLDVVLPTGAAAHLARRDQGRRGPGTRPGRPRSGCRPTGERHSARRHQRAASTSTSTWASARWSCAGARPASLRPTAATGSIDGTGRARPRLPQAKRERGRSCSSPSTYRSTRSL